MLPTAAQHRVPRSTLLLVLQIFLVQKLPPPPPCTLSKEEVLCHSCDMGVSQFCHVLLVVSRLCHSCDNARHHMTMRFLPWNICYVILYDMT